MDNKPCQSHCSVLRTAPVLFVELFCGYPPNFLEGRQEVIAGPHSEPAYVCVVSIILTCDLNLNAKPQPDPFFCRHLFHKLVPDLVVENMSILFRRTSCVT